jgi:hypothetical protein
MSKYIYSASTSLKKYFIIWKNMPAALHSIQVDKKIIKLFDLTETDLSMEEYINNVNDILRSNTQYRFNIHDSLVKMRTIYLHSK